MTAPRDQEVRRRITTGIDRSVFVEASAGTGKTRLLVERILELIETGSATLESIAAITFTEKAAGELRVRLRNALSERRAVEGDEARRERLLLAERSLDRATVTTIHSFCGQILRERPIEAGVTPGFGVIDAIQTEQLIIEAWDTWIAKQLDDPVSPLRPIFEGGIAIENLCQLALNMLKRRDVLLDLDAAMPGDPAKDVAATMGPLRAAAGALDEEVDSALTACRKPAEDEAFSIMTGHRATISALRARLDDAGAVLAHRFLAGCGIPSIWRAGSAANWDKGILTALRKRVNDLRKAHEAWSVAQRTLLTTRAVRILLGMLDAFEQVKRERSVLDFDDHLILARNLLRDHPEVRADLRNQWRHLLVDEFQDTDPLQAEIVCYLADDGSCGRNWEEARPEPGRLFLVGDPKQSIYRFRRADIDIYRRTLAVMKKSGAVAETITVNFRTRPAITGWVNRAFARIMDQPGAYSVLDPFRAEPDIGPGMMILEVPGTGVDDEGKVTALNADDRRREEARGVAAWLLDRIGGGRQQVFDPDAGEVRKARWGDVAILFRTFTGLEIWERVLRAAGVPYHVEGGKHYFRRVEVQSLLALLRAIDDPADRVAIVAALRSPLGGFSDDEILIASKEGSFAPDGQPAAAAGMDGFLAAIRRWHGLRPVESPAAIIDRVLRESRAVEFFSLLPQGDQRVANLLKIVEEARRFEGEAGGFRALIRHLTQREAELEDEAESPVVEEGEGGTLSILSIHKSKGLEFPIVLLADMAGQGGGRAPDQIVTRDDEGRLRVGFRLGGFVGSEKGTSGCTPGWDDLVGWEKTQQAAESDRLLYVATTRARDLLILPKPTGDGKQGAFDRFIDDDWADVPVVTTDASKLPLESPAYRQGFRLPEADDSASRKRIAEHEAATAAFERECAELRAPRPGPTWIRPSDLALHPAAGETDAGEIPVPTSEREARATARAIGRAVHRLLELQPLDSEQLDREALRVVQRLEGLLDPSGVPIPAVEAQIERLVRTALAHPIWARAQKSSRVVREASLLAATGPAERIEGIADLLFEEGGRLVLVDWKTDALGGGDAAVQARLYEPQIEAYRRALEAVAPLPPGEAFVIFLDGGVAIPLGGGGFETT